MLRTIRVYRFPAIDYHLRSTQMYKILSEFLLRTIRVYRFPAIDYHLRSTQMYKILSEFLSCVRVDCLMPWRRPFATGHPLHSWNSLSRTIPCCSAVLRN